MTFKYDHEFQCQGCRTVISVKTKGNAMVEPPLLAGGSRTLHCEHDERSSCMGLLRYTRTKVTPVSDQQYIGHALRFMVVGNGVPSKVACLKAIDDMWLDGLARGLYHSDMGKPEALWESVQGAQARVNDEAERRRPKNAQDALKKVIEDGAGRDMRTLAVAFNRKLYQWKTGYSAGCGGLVWSRNNGHIQVFPVTAIINPLMAELEKVNKVPELGREVWVCAEVDAAVKALQAGWSLDDLSFAAAEYPNGYWRDIEACGHCSQWC